MSEARSLRQQHTEATRDAIIDAFLDLAHETNAVTIDVPAVARRAGVSIRTVYRYFPSKDALQSAAALCYSDRAQATQAITEVNRTTFRPYLEALWAGFAADVPAVTAEHCTPVGRRLRTARLARARAQVSSGSPGLSAERVDLIIAVTSSSMFLELVSRMGYPPQQAADMAHWLAEQILSTADETEPT